MGCQALDDGVPVLLQAGGEGVEAGRSSALAVTIQSLRCWPVRVVSTSAKARTRWSAAVSSGQRARTWAGWRGAVRLGVGRFEPRRPSSVRLASLAQRSRGATASGRWRRARQRSGLADKGKNFWFRGCICWPMGHQPGPTTRTAVRGAPPLREKLVSSSGRQKRVARRSLSSPLLTYSALAGLRQDPGRAAESSAEATTCGNEGTTCGCCCRRMGDAVTSDCAVRLRAPGAEVRVCAPPDWAERPPDSSEGRQPAMRTCPTRGSTELAAPVIRSTSAVRRSTAASEVSQ